MIIYFFTMQSYDGFMNISKFPPPKKLSQRPSFFLIINYFQNHNLSSRRRQEGCPSRNASLRSAPPKSRNKFLDFGPPSYVAEGGHGFWRSTLLSPQQ